MAHRPPQRRSPQQKGAFVLTLSVLTAIFFLLGVAMLWLAVQAGLRLAPTPTPTATARAAYTPSPDARATHITEDMLTQVAVAATVITQLTAAPPLPIGSTPVAIPTAAGTVVVQVPLISTDNGQPASPYPPPDGGQPPNQGPTVGCNDDLHPQCRRWPTASRRCRPPACPLPPPPPPVGNPTPGLPAHACTDGGDGCPAHANTNAAAAHADADASHPYLRAGESIAGHFADGHRKPTYTLRVGPSNVYTAAGTLPAGAAIQLRGRSPAGDWVFACCVENNAAPGFALPMSASRTTRSQPMRPQPQA